MEINQAAHQTAVERPVATRVSFAIVTSVLIVAASVAAAVSSQLAFPLDPTFMAAFVAVSAVLDFLTSMMLFDLYRIEGRPMILGAACSYLLTATLIVPYGLMFPGVYPRSAALGNEQTSIWIWLTWHLLFVAVVLGTIRRSVLTRTLKQRERDVRRAIAASLLSAVCVTICCTAYCERLPIAVQLGNYTHLCASVAGGIAVITLVACGVIIRSDAPRSEMRVWLAVALLASACDLLLNAFSPHRFSISWYVGKVEMLITASVVLLALMRTWASLYAASVCLTESLRVTFSERVRLQERYDREHTIAATLQEASLPRELPNFENLHISAVYQPAVRDLEIGGDWYDVFVLADDRLVLTIGDVAGKGLEASLVMGKVRQMLRLAAVVEADPAAMLNHADQALQLEHPHTMVTAFVAILDRADGTLAWASAGHPPSFIRHSDGSVETLDSSALPLGIREGDPPTQCLVLHENSMLVAYTDGLIEASHDMISGLDAVKLALQDESIFTERDPALALHTRVVGCAARDDVAVVTLTFLHQTRSGAQRRWLGNSDDVESVAKIRLGMKRMLELHHVANEQIYNIELAYSELIGNVTRYAPGRFESVLDFTNERTVLTVTDHGKGFAYVPSTCADPLAEHGRGLFLVAALSSSLSVARAARGGSVAHVVFHA